MRYDVHNTSYSTVPTVTMRSSRKKNNLVPSFCSRCSATSTHLLKVQGAQSTLETTVKHIGAMHHIVGQKITVGGHLGVFCHGNVSDQPEHFSSILQGGEAVFGHLMETPQVCQSPCSGNQSSQ